MYCIAGNFLVRFLIWRFGEFGIDCQSKNLPIELNARVPMVVSIQIAKFKLHQHQWRDIFCQIYPVYGRLCSECHLVTV